jgi:hypothetical protein
MFSCKFQSSLLVFKITKGCHQDFSLLRIVIYSLYITIFGEKWLTLNVLSPYDHGFILPLKVRKMDYQNTKHSGISYNLVQGCQWKKLLECLKANSKFY